MHYKCHSQKREAHSKGGHHERGELPLEEETQKWGKKPPILSLNLSLMPQGVTQGVEMWSPSSPNGDVSPTRGIPPL
jgi:hypothetical protein